MFPSGEVRFSGKVSDVTSFPPFGVVPDVLFSEFGSETKKESYEDSIIRKLRTLTPAQEFSVQAVIGRSALSLAKDLEELYKKPESKTQEYVNRVCSEMMRAIDVCERLEGQERNNLFSSVSF